MLNPDLLSSGVGCSSGENQMYLDGGELLGGAVGVASAVHLRHILYVSPFLPLLAPKSGSFRRWSPPPPPPQGGFSVFGWRADRDERDWSRRMGLGFATVSSSTTQHAALSLMGLYVPYRKAHYWHGPESNSKKKVSCCKLQFISVEICFQKKNQGWIEQLPWSRYLN